MRASLPVVLTTFVVFAGACNRTRSTSAGDVTNSTNKTVTTRLPTTSTDAAKPIEAGLAAQEADIEKAERLMAGFGLRLARSPDDDRLTTIVQNHLRKMHKTLPASYRFVISKRRDGWAVDALDFEAILRGERPHSTGAYHIEDKAGRLKLLYIEADI